VENKSKISIGIVEDEALIADHIAMCLEDLNYSIAFIADDAETALSGLSNELPDVILVDINLNGNIDGVDLVHKINATYQLPIIYLTSNSEKATIDRVKLTNPAGFILKPYTEKDLDTQIQIAMHKYFENNQISSQDTNNQSDSFFIKDKHYLVKVKYDEILYVEALDNYCAIYTKEKRYVLSQTLKSVEEKMIHHNFLRSHRSYLVNIDKIEKIQHRNLWINGKELPLSEANKKELMNRVNLL
jgi:DNA-binding LytR/AlgR family response regulator